MVARRGVAPLLVKNWQPPEPRMTPLFIECLKNNQKMYSGGCARSSTSLGISTTSLPTEQCLDDPCPLENILGLTVKGRSLFKGAPGQNSQTSLPALPELGRGLRPQLLSRESCVVSEYPGF